MSSLIQNLIDRYPEAFDLLFFFVRLGLFVYIAIGLFPTLRKHVLNWSNANTNAPRPLNAPSVYNTQQAAQYLHSAQPAANAPQSANAPRPLNAPNAYNTQQAAHYTSQTQPNSLRLPLPRAVRSHAHSPLPRQHHQRPHRQLQRPHRRHLRHPLPLIPPLALVSTLRPFPLPLPLRSLTSAPSPPQTRIPLRKTRTVSPTATASPSGNTASPSGNTASPSGNAPALSTTRLVHLLRAHRLAPFARPRTRFRPTPIGCGAVFRVKITDLTPSPPIFSIKA